jgi:hypothetical protein
MSQRNVGTYGAQPVGNQETIGAVGLRVKRTDSVSPMTKNCMEILYLIRNSVTHSEAWLEGVSHSWAC